jgi:hypothetical protein
MHMRIAMRDVRVCRMRVHYATVYGVCRRCRPGAQAEAQRPRLALHADIRHTIMTYIHAVAGSPRCALG